MFKNLAAYLDKSIYLAYLAITIITPLLFSTKNSELFEVPKMLFVYLGAIIILTLSHLKFALFKKHSYPANLIFISLLVLLATQIASTFLSIDKFTSIYGFPSRLNGGALSLVAYIIIFAGALINLDKEKILRLFLATVLTATAVSLWGIPGHFGYDPNCFLLTGHLTSTCWQKDFDPTLRIFSTLGQPNWLASYLVLVIPISISFVFLTKRLAERVFFVTSTIMLLTALILTDSRAGFVGFVISLVLFIVMLGTKNLKKYAKVLAPLLIISTVTAAIFGTSLVSRTKEALSQNTSSTAGTESSQIRLIVWRGALAVFKNHSILGTGPETFAYSYYKVRPLQHNQTTEWNFFYNKAHNEFLNYLANTGALGFGAYLVFLIVTIMILWQAARIGDEEISTIAKATIAAIIGYQITIFFGFSVVATQLLMFTFIAYILVLAKKQKLKEVNLKFLNKPLRLSVLAVVIIIGIMGITYTARLYLADIFIARARNSDLDQSSQQLYEDAISLYPSKNPFYLSDAAYSAASLIQNTKDTNQKLKLVQSAEAKADLAQKLSPNNLLVGRKVANSYFLLALIDQKYVQKALDELNHLTELAPADPQTYLAVAKIQTGLGKVDEAKKTLAQALNLKPDYVEAQQLLDQINSSTYNSEATNEPQTD